MRILAIVFCAYLTACGGSTSQVDKVSQWEPAKKKSIRIAFIKTLIDAKAYATSVPLLRKALVDNPKDPRLHLMMGTVLRERQIYAKALQSFEEAIRLAPNFGLAYSGQAITLNMQGKHDAALVLHQKAVSLAPKDPRLLNNLGFGYSIVNRHSDAVQSYQEALALNPNQRNTYVNLGFAFAMLGDEASANQAFSQVLTPGETLNNLALANELKGNPDAAAKLYEEAVALSPDLEIAQDNLSAVQDDIKKNKEEE